MSQAGAIQLPFTDSSTTKVDFIGWVKSNFGGIIPKTEIDNLSFMGTFKFPKIEEMRSTLQQSGEYTTKQIEEIIAGLKTLPEYRE